jgi:UDP-2-acetamido-2-deoxy-ribo-hexuluronate aminotransferase
MAFLWSRGVETRAYFSPPVHQQRFFARFADRRLPVTERVAERVITLPFFTTITQNEMDYVAESLSAAESALS